jgi:outer membrane protein TolC
VVQNRYEAGLATITELLRAETATAQARMNLIAAEYSQRMSYANVLFATGTLTNAGVFAKGGAE